MANTKVQWAQSDTNPCLVFHDSQGMIDLDRPVAAFHNGEDARLAVQAVNAAGDRETFRESDDAADVGDLVIRAAEQLIFAGPKARASVRFAMEDQWFSVALQMSDAPEEKI